MINDIVPPLAVENDQHKPTDVFQSAEKIIKPEGPLTGKHATIEQINKQRNEQRQSHGLMNKPERSRSTPDPKHLQLRLTGAAEPIDEVLSLPPGAHATLLDVLTVPAPQSERVERLGNSLLTLAGEPALIETGVSPSPTTSDEMVNNAVTEAADA